MFEVYNNDSLKKIRQKIEREFKNYNESIQYNLIQELFEKVEEYDSLTFFRLIIDFIPSFSVSQKRYVLTFFDESVKEENVEETESVFDRYIKVLSDEKNNYEKNQREKIVDIFTKAKNMNLLEFL